MDTRVLFIGLCVVCLAWWAYGIYQRRKANVFTDKLAVAFVEAAEHIFAGKTPMKPIEISKDGNGGRRIAPFCEWDADLQVIMSEPADEYVMERYELMLNMRDEARKVMGSGTVLGKRYREAMDKLCNTMGTMVQAMGQPELLEDAQTVNDVNFFFFRRNYIRDVLMFDIVSTKTRPLVESEGHRGARDMKKGKANGTDGN